MYYVYILANGTRGTLYIGVTNDLARRIAEHREGEGSGSAWRYGIFRLVHAQGFDGVEAAILQEKRLKRWRRAWKVELIEAGNPEWRDLCQDMLL